MVVNELSFFFLFLFHFLLAFTPSFFFFRMDKCFRELVLGGRAEDVAAFLQANPKLDVNLKDEVSQRAALHDAVNHGHLEIVQVLLGHPGINVNVQTGFGQTPFLISCASGHIAVVRLLLRDPRVDVNLVDHDKRTSLWLATFNLRVDVIERLLASGRHIGNLERSARYSGSYYSPLGITKMMSQFQLTYSGQIRSWAEVVLVLKKFEANPAQTRHVLRVKLGVLDALAAEIFASTVFLCDGLLQLTPASPSDLNATAAIRFFAIAAKLPMELQMILCHRVIGSTKQHILHRNSEYAFEDLGRILSIPSSTPPSAQPRPKARQSRTSCCIS